MADDDESRLAPDARLTRQRCAGCQERLCLQHTPGIRNRHRLVITLAVLRMISFKSCPGSMTLPRPFLNIARCRKPTVLLSYGIDERTMGFGKRSDFAGGSKE